MAKFVVASLKTSAKGNIVASLSLPADGRIKSRSAVSKLFRAFVDDSIVLGEELELDIVDFKTDTFKGDDGTEISVEWYDPA